MPDIKMPDINNAIIAGSLTNDPVLRKTANGTTVANFSITSNRKYRDNSGVWRENVCYIGVVAWHKLAEACGELLKRGSAIIIDGELQSKIWRSENGSSRNLVEIRARRVQFLDQQSAKDVEETSNVIQTDKTQKDSTVSEEAPASRNIPETIKVEPTDFDFGYQDL